MKRRHFLKTTFFTIAGLLCGIPKAHTSKIADNTVFSNINTQGWITIPSDFCDLIGSSPRSTLTVSRMDGRLVVYPPKEWHELKKKIDERAIESETVRKFRHFFVHAAVECPVSKQGHMLIPKDFRDYAHLKRKAVVIKAQDHFQIWDYVRWRTENKRF